MDEKMVKGPDFQISAPASFKAGLIGNYIA